MKFYALITPVQNTEQLLSDYKSAWEVGILRLGKNHLYFRKFRKIYYIPYDKIRRCFRRVISVPAKLCCGKGNFELEHLVVCSDDREIAQIQLPDTRAAKILIDELKQRIPDAEFTKPNAPQSEP